MSTSSAREPATVESARSRDAELVGRLRAGDAAAFAEIVDDWSASMLQLARTYVSTRSSAEEIVQECWLAVFRGLDAFEGRSSLRTWTYRILTNLAKTRGVSEARVLPWAPGGDDGPGPTVDPSRFRGAGEKWAGGWTPEGAPTSWEPSPESALIGAEIRSLLSAALSLLPERQRQVVSLRDIQGMSADEAGALMGISSGNQRVLLHRGRARLRLALEGYYRDMTSEVMS